MKKKIQYLGLLVMGVLFLFGYSDKTEAIRVEHRGSGLHQVCQRTVETYDTVCSIRAERVKNVPREDVVAERETRREANQNYCVEHDVENCLEHQEQRDAYCQNREQGQHHNNQQRGQGHGRRHGWSN